MRFIQNLKEKNMTLVSYYWKTDMNNEDVQSLSVLLIYNWASGQYKFTFYVFYDW
jgi:hypothetical protein